MYVGLLVYMYVRVYLFFFFVSLGIYHRSTLPGALLSAFVCVYIYMYIDSDESFVASAQAVLVEEGHSCNSRALGVPGPVNRDETNPLFQNLSNQKISFLLKKVEDVSACSHTWCDASSLRLGRSRL